MRIGSCEALARKSSLHNPKSGDITEHFYENTLSFLEKEGSCAFGRQHSNDCGNVCTTCDTPISSIYDYTSLLHTYCHTHLAISFLCHLPPRPIHHGFYFAMTRGTMDTPPWTSPSICCFLSHWLLPPVHSTFWSNRTLRRFVRNL
jgi:hypothetical protein